MLGQVFGNCLTEQDQKEEYITFVEDKNWIYVSMIFAHFFIDDALNILTVHLDKYIDFDSKVYKMSSATCEELVTLYEKFEESLIETGNMRSEVESKNSGYSATEMDNSIQNHIVDCVDIVDKITLKTKKRRKKPILQYYGCIELVIERHLTVLFNKNFSFFRFCCNTLLSIQPE